MTRRELVSDEQGGDQSNRRSVRRQWALWWLVWVLTRAFMVTQVGFWNTLDGPQFQDVNFYEATSNHLADTRTMPVGDSWQYPPLAAFLLLVPRLAPDYFVAFVVVALIVDAVGLLLLGSRRNQLQPSAAWYWLLLLPMLAAFPVLRFDIVPTVAAIAALLLARRRPFVAGLALGVGVLIKLWPITAIVSEWNPRRLARMGLGLVLVGALSFGAAALTFGDQSLFLTNQAGRGLQVESVGATPWHLRQMVTGQVVQLAQRNGTNEVASGRADLIANRLQVATLVAVVLVCCWFFARDRLIRKHDRHDLTSVALGRDAVFAATCLAIITNGTLSPQFLIWLVGIGAVCMGTVGTRLRQPLLMVAAAVILTFGLYQSPAIMVARNALLVMATLGACVRCVAALRSPGAPAGVCPDGHAARH